MNATLKELRGKIAAKREEIKGIFDEAGPDNDMSKVTSIEGDSAAKVEHIRKLNDELDGLVDEAAPLEEQEASLARARANVDRLDEIRRPPIHPTGGAQPQPVLRTLGELFVGTRAYEERVQGGVGPVTTLELDRDAMRATLFQTTAGWAPESMRTGRVVEDAQRPVQVTDIFPGGTTTQEKIVYMEETTFTNNAAEVAEAGAYGEAALVLTERESNVRKIGVWLPITDEQLDDVAQAESYIDARLPFMIRQRLDGQLLVGNGTAPNLRGLNNVASIQTQAKGADPVPDAVYKAMTKVRVTGRAMPSHVILHPNDWQDIRLLRTADGIYIWGSPSEAGPERIWGLPVVQSDAQTENTGIVLDVGFTQLFLRKALDVQVGYQNDDFIKGRKAVRADLRAAFVAYRPEAICTVTGI